MSVASGTRLGPYEVLAPLGAGGMGEVYGARDTRLGREVAIKVLPSEVAADVSRLKRFEKEARSASALNHPNIVTIYDIGTSDSVSWIAMERVEGKTLRDLLFGGALPVKKLLSIAAQIADGLARAHEAGIVHRDLKPENLMITREGLVKILDFGLAKQTGLGSGSDEGSHIPTETGTSPGVVLGTVGYMSPEQAAGQPVDFRSDQFSFGSILYEMTTGKRAFQRKTGVDTLAAILNDDPPPIATFNPDVPVPLRWVAERCLAKDPEGRYASTKDLARELATVRDRLSETGSSGASMALWRKTPVLLPLAVLAALAAGAILTLFLSRPFRPESLPRFRQLTFGSGAILTPRFAPDGQTVVFGYQRQGAKPEILMASPGGTESRSLGFPPGNALSVSRSGEMAILIGGTWQHGTLARVPLAGGAPREVLENVWGADWSPDGAGFAVIHAVEDARRVEYPIGHVLYETRQSLSNLRISPKGDLIAVNGSGSADGSGSLLLLDPKGSRAPRPFGSTSGLFAWSPTGKEIWSSEDDRGVTTVSALSLSGRKRRVVSLPGQFLLHDVSREGTLLMERSAFDPAIFGRLPGDEDERDLTWLDGSIPADISADGRLVLFTESGAGGGPARSVYLWKAQDRNAVRLGDGTALALSPDGKWALATGDAPTRLRLLPTGAGEPRSLDLSSVRPGGSNNAHSPVSGTFFPDSKRVLVTGFEGKGGRRLFVVDLDGGKPRPVGPEGAFFTDGAHGVSPDGRSIAAFGPDHRTRLFPVDGGQEAAGTPIPGAAEKEEAIQWCADGRCVFVGGDGPSGDGIYRLDIRTGSRVLWKSAKSFKNAGPNFNYCLPSPDGRWYVYGFYRLRSNLFLVDGVK